MNSNHALIGNGRLPFEVLVQVFEYYSEQETPFRPQETLLLVCKAWTVAANGHPSLWTNYRINLSSTKTMMRWLHLTPYRLRRSGPQMLLQIDIRHTGGPSQQAFQEVVHSRLVEKHQVDIKTTVIRLLGILAGENGAHCARWKSLRILLDSPLIVFRGKPDGTHELSSLNYPMPLLTSLHLKLRSGHAAKSLPLFPELPSINSITLENSFLQNYPDMRSAKEVSMRGGYSVEDGVRYGLINAPNVEYLHFLYDGYVFCHPQEYPKLRVLSLEGRCMTRNLEQAQMPQLTTIILVFHRAGLVQEVSALPVINHIHTLYLIGSDDYAPRGEGLEAIPGILRACTSLQLLYINDYALSFLLEDWPAWRHLFMTGYSARVILKISKEVERPLSVECATTVKDLRRVASCYRLTLPDPL
ncbi:hypothetical protein FRC17_002169 [Serendipita sp. 399]|nr:hypothetical protein FRC17_002169 [Serendipita sp. 399]